MTLDYTTRYNNIISLGKLLKNNNPDMYIALHRTGYTLSDTPYFTSGYPEWLTPSWIDNKSIVDDDGYMYHHFIEFGSEPVNDLYSYTFQYATNYMFTIRAPDILDIRIYRLVDGVIVIDDNYNIEYLDSKIQYFDVDSDDILGFVFEPNEHFCDNIVRYRTTFWNECSGNLKCKYLGLKERTILSVCGTGDESEYVQPIYETTQPEDNQEISTTDVSKPIGPDEPVGVSGTDVSQPDNVIDDIIDDVIIDGLVSDTTDGGKLDNTVFDWPTKQSVTETELPPFWENWKWYLAIALMAILLVLLLTMIAKSIDDGESDEIIFDI